MLCCEIFLQKHKTFVGKAEVPLVSNAALVHDRKPCSPLPKRIQKAKARDCFTLPLRSLMWDAASLLLLFQCMQGRKNMSPAVFVIQVTAVYVPLKMLICHRNYNQLQVLILLLLWDQPARAG